MDPRQEQQRLLTRRTLLSQGARGLGSFALASMMGEELLASGANAASVPAVPHFKPKAKRVIYMFFSGGPSHIDMFDFKPASAKNPWPWSCRIRSGRGSGSRG